MSNSRGEGQNKWGSRALIYKLISWGVLLKRVVKLKKYDLHDLYKERFTKIRVFLNDNSYNDL